MDEIFEIEKTIGEIIAIIGLQFNYDKEYVDESEIVYEQFPEPVVEEKKQQLDENGEPVEQEEAKEEEEGEEKKPKFKPEDYKWTVTDGKPKNLP